MSRLLATCLLAVALGVAGCNPEASGGGEPSPSAPAPSARHAGPPAPAPAPSRAPLPPPVEPERFDAGTDGRLSLREFYLQKYPTSEREAVRRTADEVLRRYSPGERDLAVSEILAFHHVVYHRTRQHDLERNHAVARRLEGRLREVARRFDVPFLPLLAIISWENSGSLDQVSWADAAGPGQMTPGAVQRAHEYAEAEAARLEPELAAARSLGQDERALDLMQRIRALDVARRHEALRKEAHQEDERQVVQCNLEDAALFFRYLLSSYGGREDLAISAYHNGVLNTDDLLHDYLWRQGEDLDRNDGDRSALLEALERRDVKFLDLWRDRRSRQMLNGLRTVEGERTNPGNSHMALGDESDLYPWKVLASLAAYLAGPEWTARVVARYSDRWDLVEVRGLPEWSTRSAREDALGSGALVKIDDPGLALDASGDPEDAAVTPELAGYLAHLAERLRASTGNPRVRVPVTLLADSGSHACLDGDGATHLRGVAADLRPQGLAPAHAKALQALLWEDYLMDRIYLRRREEGVHLVLNPRRGDDYLASYRKRDAAPPTGADPAGP